MITIVMSPGTTGALLPLLDGLPRWRKAVRLRLAAHPDAEDLATLVVDESGIRPALPWGDEVPPYLLPTLPLTAETLAFWLELVEAGEPTPAARERFADDVAHLTALARGTLSTGRLPEADDHRSAHDRAILHHYAAVALADPETAIVAYDRALALAPDAARHAFTARQYATLLLDLERPAQAMAMLAAVDDEALPEAGRMAIRAVRLPATLLAGTDAAAPATLEALHADAVALRGWYEAHDEPLRAALLRLDEAQLLQRLGRFADAVATVDEASRVLEQADEAELFAAAALRRAEVQHAWAQSGARAQFSRAMESFQEALTVFSREASPHVFGTIHHQLAVLYAEMPVEPVRRPMLLALAGRSFDEALRIFDVERHPLHHAEIRANYGNALLRCPESQLREPAARAIDELQRALAIYRQCEATAPHALVLLNLLEAQWQLGWAADDEAAGARRLDDLDATWRELSGLPVPTALADDVERWRERLAAAHAAG